MDAAEEIAGSVPEIPLECEQIQKDGGGFWDVSNGGYLPEDLVLSVKRLNGYIMKVSTELFRCKVVQMQARSCWS